MKHLLFTILFALTLFSCEKQPLEESNQRTNSYLTAHSNRYTVGYEGNWRNMKDYLDTFKITLYKPIGKDTVYDFSDSRYWRDSIQCIGLDTFGHRYLHYSITIGCPDIITSIRGSKNLDTFIFESYNANVYTKYVRY